MPNFIHKSCCSVGVFVTSISSVRVVQLIKIGIENVILQKRIENLYSKTGLKVVAHNRYWATDNVYATQNGGSYNFIVENDTKRALPQDNNFWVNLFSGMIDEIHIFVL